MVVSAVCDTTLSIVIKIRVFIALLDKQGKIFLKLHGCCGLGVRDDFTTQSVVIFGIAEGPNGVSRPATRFFCWSIAVVIV